MTSFAKADTSEAASNVGRILNFPRIYIKYDYKLQKLRGEFQALKRGVQVPTKARRREVLNRLLLYVLYGHPNQILHTDDL